MTNKPIFGLALALTFLARTTHACAQGAARNARPAVIAYYATKTIAVDSFATGKLTHIIFSFCHLQGNKMVVTNTYDSAIVRQLVNLKDKNPRLKVILSLGGWAGCSTCSEVFASKKGRRQFVRSVDRLISYFRADGVDLDWEYPGLPNAPGYAYSTQDKDDFTLLIKKLREKLPVQEEISFAAGGFTGYLAASVDWKRIAPLVNRINLMTYDLVNGYDTTTGHHTPLYSTLRQQESADHAVRYLDSIGVPPAKLVIGGAFYGRLFEDVDSLDNGLYRPGRFKRSIPYRDLAAFLAADSGFVYHWDPAAKAPYLYNPGQRLFLTYDDSLSVSLKTRYVLDKQLGGIMFWQLGEDCSADGLLDAIDRAIHDNTGNDAEKN